MLSRRHIRIKVLQALYEYFQNPVDMSRGEKKLSKTINAIFELYLHELKALKEILHIAEEKIEIKRNKKLPTPEDINPNLRFVENSFLNWLRNNKQFAELVEKLHISWSENRETLGKLFRDFQKSDDYHAYMNAESTDIDSDKRIVRQLYGKYITNSDLIHQIYEERNMHWADDLDAAQMMVSKTIKKFDIDSSEESSLPRLLKDRSDLDFALTLYRKCILKSDDYEKRIHEKARNWETDRIAVVDIILMKMALAELVNFKEIPVKVSLNEYIELSKEYSTPKSGNFINGIIDTLKDEMMASGEIRKIGRGLL